MVSAFVQVASAVATLGSWSRFYGIWSIEIHTQNETVIAKPTPWVVRLAVGCGNLIIMPVI